MKLVKREAKKLKIESQTIKAMTYATGFVILEQMVLYFVSPVFYCPKNPWINFPQISQTGKMPKWLSIL